MFVKRSSASVRVRALVFAALASSTVMFAADATAQDPRKAQATPIFEEGLRLADKNKHAEALEKFRKAYATYPSPNTLFNVARSEHILGMTLDALRDYREALKNPILSPPLVEQARTFVGELEKTVGRVRVTGPSGASVVLGGQSYRLPIAEPIDVLPGVVTAKVENGEAPARDVSVTAAAGSVVTLDVGVAPVVDGPPPTETTPVITEPPHEEKPVGFWTTQHVVATTLTGIAVAGAAVGTGFLFVREGHVSDAEDVLARNAQACREIGSPDCAAYNDASDGASGAKTGAIVSYAVGGAAAVAALVTWLWPSRRAGTTGRGDGGASRAARHDERGITWQVLPSAHGVWMTGTF